MTSNPLPGPKQRRNLQLSFLLRTDCTRLFAPGDAQALIQLGPIPIFSFKNVQLVRNSTQGIISEKELLSRLVCEHNCRLVANRVFHGCLACLYTALRCGTIGRALRCENAMSRRDRQRTERNVPPFLSKHDQTTKTEQWNARIHV